MISTVSARAATAQHEPAGFISPATVVTTGRVNGRIPTILAMQRLGAITPLGDGRFEARFAVQANVPFALSSADNRSDEVRVSSGDVEIPLADFVGTAGYHTEILVRAPEGALLGISLESRPAAPSAARLSGVRSGS